MYKDSAHMLNMNQHFFKYVNY